MANSSNPAAVEGSSSQTVTQERNEPLVLHIRPTAETQEGSTKSKQKKKKKPKVRWTEDVVDNEHMGKKKSKICCIFHPQREFGEESCSSGSDLDSGSDSDSASECGDHHGCRPLSPNAYEKQPDYRKLE